MYTGIVCRREPQESAITVESRESLTMWGIMRHYGNIIAALWQHYGSIMTALWQHYGGIMAVLWLHYGMVQHYGSTGVIELQLQSPGWSSCATINPRR
jgi:hypothetical protein